MKTHTVLTPANIEIEYRLAGAGSRLAAFVVDFLLQIVICVVLAVVVLFGIYDYRIATLASVEGFALGFLIISWFVVYFCYFIVCELMTNGRSVGKKIFGLRVIRDNGEPIALSQSLVRGLFRSVLDILYIGLFVILFSAKHKRIGDIVAGTVVVAEHYEGMPMRPDYMPPARAIGSTGTTGVEQLEHLILSAQERDLLHMYFARKIYLPEAAALQLEREWAGYFSEKWQIDEKLIDDELLSGLLRVNEVEY